MMSSNHHPDSVLSKIAELRALATANLPQDPSSNNTSSDQPTRAPSALPAGLSNLLSSFNASAPRVLSLPTLTNTTTDTHNLNSHPHTLSQNNNNSLNNNFNNLNHHVEEEVVEESGGKVLPISTTTTTTPTTTSNINPVPADAAAVNVVVNPLPAVTPSQTHLPPTAPVPPVPSGKDRANRPKFPVSYEKNPSDPPPPPGSRLFVGNLAVERTNKVEVGEVFRVYGKVLEVSLKGSFGFVQFDNPKSCLDAIEHENGRPLAGLGLDLKISRDRVGHANRGGGGRQVHGGGGGGPRGGVGRAEMPPYNSNDRHNRFNEDRKRRRSLSPPISSNGGGGRSRSPPSSSRGPRHNDHDNSGRLLDDVFKSQVVATFQNLVSRVTQIPIRKEGDIVLPQRQQIQSPDIQVLAFHISNDYADFIESTFRKSNLTLHILFIEPNVSQRCAVRQLFSEGVKCVFILEKQNERDRTLNMITIQGDRRFKEYENIQVDSASAILFHEREAWRHMQPVGVPQYGMQHAPPHHLHQQQHPAPLPPLHHHQMQQQQQQPLHQHPAMMQMNGHVGAPYPPPYHHHQQQPPLHHGAHALSPPIQPPALPHHFPVGSQPPSSLHHLQQHQQPTAAGNNAAIMSLLGNSGMDPQALIAIANALQQQQQNNGQQQQQQQQNLLSQLLGGGGGVGLPSAASPFPVTQQQQQHQQQQFNGNPSLQGLLANLGAGGTLPSLGHPSLPQQQQQQQQHHHLHAQPPHPAPNAAPASSTNSSLTDVLNRLKQHGSGGGGAAISAPAPPQVPTLYNPQQPPQQNSHLTANIMSMLQQFGQQQKR